MPALLPRVKSKLFIHANRRTSHLLDGEYRSILAGRSLDFDDLREYVPGDEVEDIDWKATARHGAPLVKRYLHTRRHDVVLVVDTGRGMAAAAEGGETKTEVAIMIAGVLGYLSLRHGDAVALVSGSVEGVRMRPARSTEGHLESLLRTVQQEARLEGPASDHPALVRHVVRTLRRRSIVVVIGDDAEPEPAMDELLRQLRVRHEVLWITIADLDLMRGDGSARTILDVDGRGPVPGLLRGSRRLARRYAEIGERRRRAQAAYFRAAAVSHARVRSTGEVVPSLLTLLRRRRRAGY
ncbi:MAG: DUF58 domain-containing protein [Actinomycetales bacterium]|nr:DUF58 domain-containing protein [Actinomycetales bacterium]